MGVSERFSRGSPTDITTLLANLSPEMEDAELAEHDPKAGED